jgi:hypothetical protein
MHGDLVCELISCHRKHDVRAAHMGHNFSVCHAAAISKPQDSSYSKFAEFDWWLRRVAYPEKTEERRLWPPLVPLSNNYTTLMASRNKVNAWDYDYCDTRASLQGVTSKNEHQVWNVAAAGVSKCMRPASACAWHEESAETLRQNKPKYSTVRVCNLARAPRRPQVISCVSVAVHRQYLR